MADWSLAAKTLGNDDAALSAVPSPPAPQTFALDRACVAARDLSARRALLRAETLRTERRRTAVAASSHTPTAHDVAAARAAADRLAGHFRRGVRDAQAIVDCLTPTPSTHALRVAPHLHANLTAFVTYAIAADDMRVAAQAQAVKQMNNDSALDSPILAAEWLAAFHPEREVLDSRIHDEVALLSAAGNVFEKTRLGHTAMKRLYDKECASPALESSPSKMLPELLPKED